MNSTNERFLSEFIADTEVRDNDLWFIYHGNKLIVKLQQDCVSITETNDIKDCNFELKSKHYLGRLGNRQCFTAIIDETGELPEALQFKELRPMINLLDDELFMLAGRAFQITNWDENHKYCGKCGTLVENKQDERAKICPQCGLINYPRICPAIITAIVKDNKILLAHGNHFRNKMYSVIAGFVEPGETFEDCVQREVMEEVGLKVKNIKYYASQPWPFPNSLMVGFTAEYDSGEIKIDEKEIGDAGWYSVDEFPEIPAHGSIARRLINWFIENNNKKGI